MEEFKSRDLKEYLKEDEKSYDVIKYNDASYIGIGTFASYCMNREEYEKTRRMGM